MHPAQLDALGRGTVGQAVPSEYDYSYPRGVLESLGGLYGTKKPVHDANPLHVVDRVVGRTRQDVEAKIGMLQESRRTMKEYLSLKYVENDMHGVQDAASDIRDIDAELAGLRWVLGP